MNQQMIHGLPITETYATPIDKIKPLLFIFTPMSILFQAVV